jgi:uncharacterized protein YbjQ (UPF0145 family)
VSATLQAIRERTGVYLLSVQTLERWDIVEYYGLVSGRAILGANFLKDFFARVADVTGGRVGGYERALAAAEAESLEEMALAARALGANAVIAVHMNTGAVGPRMLMSQCWGTAVRLRPQT